MTKTKIAALAMIVIWPIAMFYGYRFGGFLHIALAMSLVMWFMETLDKVPVKRQARRARLR